MLNSGVMPGSPGSKLVDELSAISSVGHLLSGDGGDPGSVEHQLLLLNSDQMITSSQQNGVSQKVSRNYELSFCISIILVFIQNWLLAHLKLI